MCKFGYIGWLLYELMILLLVIMKWVFCFVRVLLNIKCRNIMYKVGKLGYIWIIGG